jgi:hypothetical protein
MSNEEVIEINKVEYNRMLKELEDIEKKKDIIRQKRNEWTYKYVNKAENIEKIKEKRREYARKQYEKQKTNEDYMQKKREKSLENYYKKKEEKILKI